MKANNKRAERLTCKWCGAPVGEVEKQEHDNPDFAEYRTCRDCGYQWAKKYWGELKPAERQVLSVLYLRKHSNMFLFFSSNRFEDLDAKYVYLPVELWENWNVLPIPAGFLKGKSKEQVFGMLNRSDENPMAQPSGQRWIRSTGTSHTSMSVGDMVFDGEDYWVCLNHGFKKVAWLYNRDRFKNQKEALMAELEVV